MRPLIDEAAIDGLKFFACLPPITLPIEMLEQRLSDTDSIRKILEQNETYVAGATGSD